MKGIGNTVLMFRYPRVLRRSWAPVCAVRWMGMVEDQRSGDFVARLLGNRDAGNSDARHFADGHLEQEI
jgi:hypothetical protein